MAPMIESPFAMQKFVDAAHKVHGKNWKDIEWIINAETKTCHQNLDAILEKGKDFLSTVSIGRVDLSASMGLTRNEINGSTVFEATKILRKEQNSMVIRLISAVEFHLMQSHLSVIFIRLMTVLKPER